MNDLPSHSTYYMIKSMNKKTNKLTTICLTRQGETETDRQTDRDRGRMEKGTPCPKTHAISLHPFPVIALDIFQTGVDMGSFLTS